uniref:Reverse transcriptase domain-containing protein n=1 Tax=Tanacetum cinerariifolium TaxID=118510 RepID=A0A6L2KDT9_TANCI|nr:reverse transcriptase domain-containing protein [Tanacetum cinerariifolium]
MHKAFSLLVKTSHCQKKFPLLVKKFPLLKKSDATPERIALLSENRENHALVADEEAPTEFSLMAKTSAESKVFDNSLCSKALHQLDTFYNALNPNDQDALDSAAGGNFLDKIPRDGLVIIESKSKVRYSRSRVIDSRVNTNAPLLSSSSSNSFELQQIAASLEDKLDIRMSRFEKSLNDIKALVVTPPAPIKAV